MNNNIQQRKKDHIDIVLNKEVETNTGIFDKYKLPYSALPEIDMGEIELKTTFFNWEIAFPFIISSMTGGEQYGRTINENIAKACNQLRIPFGLGSMRVIIKHPESVETFKVKQFAQNVPMFANIGLVQLNYGFTENEILHLIDSVQADGIFIHLNHLQEAVQPEGDTNFKELIPKLKKVLQHIQIPVVIKEVGHGIDLETYKKLRDVGVDYFDVAGVGGSSWAWIEGYRRTDHSKIENLGYLMRDFGINTDQAILDIRNFEVRHGSKPSNLIAGGGIRNGLDLAKSLALGANYATAAKPFLKAALESDEEVLKILLRFKQELQVSMFASGFSSISELNSSLLEN